MRILFDARLLSNQTTGISDYIRNLLNVLLKIKGDNFYKILLRNDIVHRENEDLLELVNSNANITFFDVPAIGPINQILTPLLLREKNIDIYHYPHFDLPGFTSYRSVITIHDLKYIIKPDFFPGLSILKKKYIQTILKRATTVAKKVICVSEATKADLLNLFSIGDDKVHVVHLGANFINQGQNGEDFENFFLCVGERRPHKNLVRVIEAFDRFLQRTASSFKLLIVGKRYRNYKEPESKVKALGRDDSIKFLGYVSESELLNYYQKACALLFPSMYEGFGLPILEAMACATPVITSNISAMPEIAGNAALLVNPYDINEIVTRMELVINQDIRLDLVSKGFKNIKRFDWNKTAEKTLEIYEKCKIK